MGKPYDVFDGLTKQIVVDMNPEPRLSEYGGDLLSAKGPVDEEDKPFKLL